MKQAILELKKKLLLVELPEAIRVGYSMFDNEGNCHLEYYTDKRCIKTNVVIDINSKNYKLTDITEEQFWNFVSMHKVSNDTWRYANYKNLSGQWFDTAKESFFSYLEKEGIYFGNPYGEEPFVPYYAPYGMTIDEYNFELRAAEYKMIEWQEAESKVWNKNLIHVFELI